MKRMIALCSNVNQFHEFKITHFTGKLQQRHFSRRSKALKLVHCPLIMKINIVPDTPTGNKKEDHRNTAESSR